MGSTKQKIKEIKEDVLDRTPKKFIKRVSIVYDGKQYSVRVPKDFADKAGIDIRKDCFEFRLEIPEDKSELPQLYGELIDKKESRER